MKAHKHNTTYARTHTHSFTNHAPSTITYTLAHIHIYTCIMHHTPHDTYMHTYMMHPITTYYPTIHDDDIWTHIMQIHNMEHTYKWTHMHMYTHYYYMMMHVYMCSMCASVFVMVDGAAWFVNEWVCERAYVVLCLCVFIIIKTN